MSDTVDTEKHEGQVILDLPPRNKKTVRSRGWAFTLNNWDESDVLFLTDTLDTEKYVFQEEIGEKTGTPHLQGIVYFKNARTWDQMKQLNPKIHWGVAISVKASIDYCSKLNTRSGEVYNKGFRIPEQLDLISELYTWQKNIYENIKTKPDKRTINWIYDPTGNQGKTELIKLIGSKLNNVVIFTGGKANDIAYQIIKVRWDPKICLFNFPRDLEGKISYNAIEQLKDGLVSSGKYEGGFKIFNSPHVYIFCNWLPNINKMSLDRWNIVHL